MRWLLRNHRSGALELVLAQTLFIAAVLSVLSLAVDWLASGQQFTTVLSGKAAIAAGFAGSAVLAYRGWRQAALYTSLIVTVSSLAWSALGYGPTPSGYFQLWALLIVPFIGVVGTIGDTRFSVVSGLVVVAATQVVEHLWGLSATERVLGFFVIALGASVAVGVSMVLNESKRQALHDERANARVNRRLARSERQRAQAERLALLGKLAAAMAHEINNPLAYTMANLRFVSSALPRTGGAEDTDLSEALTESLEGLARIHAIVDRMGAFRASTRPAENTTDVRAALGRIIDALELPAAARARLVVEVDAPLPAVTLDEPRLGRVVRTLITNALEVARSRVCIRAKVFTRHLEVLVEDDGPGVAPELLPHLFEPFETATVNGKLGLSLVLARELTRTVGGDLRVANLPQGGAQFIVELPLAS